MPVTRASFDAVPFQPQVVDQISSLLVSGAPFARNLSLFPTSRGSVAWPTASPTGETWLAELAPFPAITINDDSYVVAVAKIGGLVNLSNESIADAVFNIESALGNVLRDTLSADLDNGLLYGLGAPAPNGIVAVATDAAAGADLRSAVINAWGELVGAGANPSSVVAFVNPVTAATEMARTTTDGVPVHPDGAELRVGSVPLLPVPKLLAADVALVVDTSATYLVQRDDVTVDLSTEFGFDTDSTALRIKGRFAIAAPTPLKSLRMATITP
jgi:HK97 family phage major capsid protein